VTIPHTEKPMMLLLETYPSGQRGIFSSLLHPRSGMPTPLSLLKDAVVVGVDIEELTDIAKNAKNWTEWRSFMEEIIHHG